MRAQARQFHHPPLRMKTVLADNLIQRRGDFRRMDFIHPAALRADHKQHQIVRPVILRAGNEGISAFKPMRQPLRDQKIQRAIDADRSPLLPVCFRQPFDQLIGTQRPVIGIKSGEHQTADRGQSFPPTAAQSLCPFERRRGLGGPRRRMGATHCLDIRTVQGEMILMLRHSPKKPFFRLTLIEALAHHPF